MSDRKILKKHPEFQVRKFWMGHENAPIMVIDNLVDDPDYLVEISLELNFAPMGKAFPGVRASAPSEYQDFVLQQLHPDLLEHFSLGDGKLKFSMCHYSLITTPPHRLAMVQRIPHFDSLDSSGLASIHYLFRAPLGGTAFYRHRKTGFEYIDESRKLTYLKSLESENGGPDMPSPGYINGDTALFQQIAYEEGIFNRMLIYRRNSLHSGCINNNFIPEPNPATGRLSINSFIDIA